jgi:cyclic pyranopterin phosphate synthase
VYSFEGLLPDLESPPIAARRAFDHAGLRLSVEGWRSLSLEARGELTLAGVHDQVDVERVLGLAGDADPAAARVAPAVDPDASRPPEAMVRALKPGGAPLPERWARLRGVDRYALWHAYRRATARSALSMLDEAVASVLAAAPEGPVPHARAALRADAPEPAAGTMPPPVAMGGAPGPAPLSNHLTRAGEVHMVDVARKPATERRAIASGSVRMRRETLARLVHAEAPKGDVLATARIAAIMAAKRTHELVPLCHPVALTHVEVSLATDDVGEDGATDRASGGGVVRVTATVDALDRTGCEMEAMVAVTTACLTVYDMLKGIDRDMVIADVMLLEKSGGRSGHYRRGPGTS